MIRRLAFASLLALAGCDRHYTFHLEARVTADGAPIAGALLVPLSSRGLKAARTGVDGTATADYRAFNSRPSDYPIAIHAAGHPLRIALSGRDFEARNRGVFSATDQQGRLEIDLGRPSPDLRAQLACTAASCQATAPHSIGVSCNQYLVQISPDGARTRLVEETRPVTSGPGTVRLTFSLPPTAEGEIFAVAICASEGGPLRVLIGERPAAR